MPSENTPLVRVGVHEFDRAEMESATSGHAVCCRHCGLPFHVIVTR